MRTYTFYKLLNNLFFFGEHDAFSVLKTKTAAELYALAGNRTHELLFQEQTR
jgi:hypothetical protein